MLRSAVFNHVFPRFNQPILQRKASAFAIDDLPGLWRLHWKLGDRIVLSTFYTRIDQACLFWGLITILIFWLAQFTAIDWSIQAAIGSVLTLLGTAIMIGLTQYCREVKLLQQVVQAWSILMIAGVVITDLAIGLGWGWILINLCNLWLSLSALGYLFSGLSLRSLTFCLIGIVHILAILLLPYFSMWQFLFTGIVIGASAIIIAELQWDSTEVCTIHELSNRIEDEA